MYKGIIKAWRVVRSVEETRDAESVSFTRVALEGSMRQPLGYHNLVPYKRSSIFRYRHRFSCTAA